MTYGIEVYNEFGELAFDFNKVLTIVESGSTKSSLTIGMASTYAGSFFQYYGPVTQELYAFVTESPSAYPHHIGTSTGRFLNSNASQSRFPRPLVSTTSTYFYQVGSTGLLHHSEHVIDPAYWSTTNSEYGMFALVLPGGNTPLQYIRVDIDDFSGLTGNYGMKLFDSTGAVSFDSRSDFLSVSEVFFVPQATISSILNSGTTHTLNLRTPLPNCYVSSPNYTSFLRPNQSSYRHVKITQTNDSTLTLSRQVVGPNPNAGSIAIYNDTVIIVARNPFA